MKSKLLLLFFLLSFFVNAQTRKINGKVIGEYSLETIPDINILTADTVLLGKADRNGNFKVELPDGADQLLLSGLGWDWTFIKIPEGCVNLEIIILHAPRSDFMSAKKVNKDWNKRLKDRENQHRQAHKKGIFISDVPCMKYVSGKA